MRRLQSVVIQSGIGRNGPGRLIGGIAAAGATGLAVFVSASPTKRLLSSAVVNAAEGKNTTGAATMLTLYQYQVCPFCNKAQTFLEYSEVPHRRVEVNPLSKKEMKFSDYRKVPFMVVETSSGEKTQVNGSDEIVDYIAANFPKGGKKHEDSEDVNKWRNWTNDRLVRLLPPNIYRTPGESIQAFDYIAKSSNFSYFERISATYAGALAMYFIAKRSLKKYNIADARGELAESMEKWAKEGLSAEKAFHGGTNPDKADLAVFGVIRSIEGNYETWTDMKKAVGPKFWDWYEMVRSSIKPPVICN